MYPAEAALLAARGADLRGPVPLLGRFPLYAAWVGAAEALLGPRDAAVLAASGLSLAAAAAAAAWVGAGALGAWGGLAAALLFALSPSVLRGFALWGTPDLLFCALWLLFHEAWLRRRPWPLVGALAGACWLARPNFILFVPVYLAELRPEARARARWASCAAAAALAVALPWLWGQWRSGGTALNPNFIWNLAGGTLTAEPGWRYARVFALSEFAPVAGAVAAKAWAGLGRWLALLPGLWQMEPLLPFAAFGMWLAHRHRDSPGRELLLTGGVLLGAQALAFSPLRVERLGAHVAGRYELWFAPVWAMAAVLGWRAAASRRKAPAWAGAAALALAGVWYARFYALPERGFGHPAGPPSAWPELAAAAPASSEVSVATNIPGHVGWYAGRRAVLLPAGPEEFARLRALMPVGPVLISTLAVGQVTDMPYWLLLLRERAETDRFCARFGYRVAYVSPQALVLLPDRT